MEVAVCLVTCSFRKQLLNHPEVFLCTGEGHRLTQDKTQENTLVFSNQTHTAPNFLVQIFMKDHFLQDKTKGQQISTFRHFQKKLKKQLKIPFFIR